ncbi:PqiC family protein [Pinirhizobacter sp.]|jgi:hypothetical protein|uniref:PqiC family protein n=1 Tax=Pinirhizobacter sp. TaxID=2950432 RepID=UPI002F3F7556
MIRRLPLLAIVMLAGCASAPTQYHTLVPRAVAPTAPPAAFVVEILPVSVPPQVDQPQLVLRSGASDVQVLENQRWLAPLGDEVRGALSADITSALNTHDIYGLARPPGSIDIRIKVDIRRFDSELGGSATIQAGWTLRKLDGPEGAGLACATRVSEPAGGDYASLVQAHQQALGRLSGVIAQAARALATGSATGCPMVEGG